MRKFLFDVHFNLFDLIVTGFAILASVDFMREGKPLAAGALWFVIIFAGSLISTFGEHWNEVKDLWQEFRNSKRKA